MFLVECECVEGCFLSNAQCRRVNVLISSLREGNPAHVQRHYFLITLDILKSRDVPFIQV